MRQLFAALALGLVLVGTSAQASVAPAHTTGCQVAAAPKADKGAKDPKAQKPDAKKPGLLSNLEGKKVAFNPQTKKYHVQGCRYYSGKNNVLMSEADAKKKGGQPCQVCLKGKK